MGLLPLPEKLQFEVIPYVSPVLSYPIYLPNQSASSHSPYSDFEFADMLSKPKKKQLPFWALVSFGAYLLGKLGYGVLTFNDVPQAHEELMAQIQEARKDLKSKGVDVD